MLGCSGCFAASRDHGKHQRESSRVRISEHPLAEHVKQIGGMQHPHDSLVRACQIDRDFQDSCGLCFRQQGQQIIVGLDLDQGKATQIKASPAASLHEDRNSIGVGPQCEGPLLCEQEAFIRTQKISSRS